MLGTLTDVVNNARAAREVIVDRELVEGLAEHAPGNGGGEDAERFTRAALRFSKALGQLDHWDIVVRDLDEGLCDFPADRDGRLVYLCWKLGEGAIEFWHEVDAGFRGRQRVDDLTR